MGLCLSEGSVSLQAPCLWLLFPLPATAPCLTNNNNNKLLVHSIDVCLVVMRRRRSKQIHVQDLGLLCELQPLESYELIELLYGGCQLFSKLTLYQLD